MSNIWRDKVKQGFWNDVVGSFEVVANLLLCSSRHFELDVVYDSRFFDIVGTWLGLIQSLPSWKNPSRTNHLKIKGNVRQAINQLEKNNDRDDNVLVH